MAADQLDLFADAPTARDLPPIPAKCPVTGFGRCLYGACSHYREARCTHPDAHRTRGKRTRL